MSELEQAILKYYQTRGACAHYCASFLKVEREEVSKALQKLKRKGLMINEGTYWKIKV